MKFEEAIALPFKNIRSLVIGVVILLAAVLVGFVPFVGFILPLLIYFFLWGFIVNVANHAVKGKIKLGEWKKPFDLFRKGFHFFLISLVYNIPLLILLIAFVKYLIVNVPLFNISIMNSMGGSVNSTFISDQILNGNASLFLGSISTLIIFSGSVLVLSLITMYVLPSAIFSYAKDFKLKEAFSFGKVFRKAFNGNYFLSWFVAGIVFAFVAFIAVLIPFANIILIPIWCYCGCIFMFSLLGETYSKIK